MSARAGPGTDTDGFRPVLVADVELSTGAVTIEVPPSHSGLPYSSARVLTRMHGHPLGLVTVPITDGRADEAAAAIAAQVGQRIRDHLTADGQGHASGDDPCRPRARPGCSPQPAVSVVVPTCNRPSTLLPCIDSILASSVPPLEVIVVENRPVGSVVAAALAARYGEDPRVRYREEGKPGVSRARNRGLAAAKGAIVAFVDDDVLVDPEWLAQLTLAFEENPQAACVTGQILPLELESPAQLWVEQYGGFSKGFDRVVFDQSRRKVDPLFPYDCGKFGSGANAAFRSESIRGLRGFDVVLGGAHGLRSGEDIDLFLRVLLSGHTLVYEPAALVWHRHRASLPELRHQLFQYGRGLAAVITKQLVAGTQRGDLLRRIPAGLRYLLSPRSGKNVHRERDYPRTLALLELLGMITGPAAYLVSRRRSGVLIIR
jgi:GT2 family glycosyltransferase